MKYSNKLIFIIISVLSLIFFAVLSLSIISIEQNIDNSQKIEKLERDLESLSDTNQLDYIENAYIKTDGTIRNGAPDRYCTDFIPCSQNSEVTYVGETNHVSVCGIAFYDKDKRFLYGYANNGDKGTKITVTSPDKTAFCRLSTDEVTRHSSFVHVDNNSVSRASESRINETEMCIEPVICVPSESVAVVGREWNLYFKNIIKGLNDSLYVRAAISGSKILEAHQLENELRITPTEDGIGDSMIIIRVFNKLNDDLVASDQFILHVIPDVQPSHKTVLFIGDSLTDGGYYPAEIVRMAKGGITTIGTLIDTVNIGGESITIKNEGRSGWGASSYMIPQFKEYDNPFYNPTTETFDFTYYMKKQGYSTVDCVSVFLGTNLDEGTETMSQSDMTVDNLKKIVESIHDFNKDIIVIINLRHMPATQDGTGMHNNLQNSQVMVGEVFDLNRELIDNFENNPEYQNVYISELVFNLDSENDYGIEDVTVSARNPKIISIQNNNVHPSIYGHLKFADTLYSRMQYVWQD